MDKGTPVESMIFTGRTTELKNLLDRLANSKSITLLTGEAGIGKSSLLDEFYKAIEISPVYFVGYYDRSQSLVTEAHLVSYPINVLLMSVLSSINKSTKVDSNINDTTKKILESLANFIKKDGKYLALTIIEDAITKSGFGSSFALIKDSIIQSSDIRPGTSIGKEFLINQSSEDLLYNINNIFRLISEQFPNRKFILILDQIESLGKAAMDFLINFIKFLPKGFHIILSYKIEDRRWSSPSARTLYKETRDKIVFDLNGDEMNLSGLTAQDIGEWIKKRRNSKLSEKQLEKIRLRSAGIPILLFEWIEKTERFDPMEIDIRNLCGQLIRPAEDLTADISDMVDRLAVLIEPLEEIELLRYLKLNNIGQLNNIIKELIKRGIFDTKTRWFRHELVQKCFEEAISVTAKKIYHREASIFFGEKRIVIEKETKRSTPNYKYKNSLSYAHHLHNSDNFPEAFLMNRETASTAVFIGDLLTAENSYLTAIEDADRMNKGEEKINCLHDLAVLVYFTWSRYGDAYEILQIAFNYYLERQDNLNLGKIAHNMGLLFYFTDKYEIALRYYTEALNALRKVGNSYQISEVLNSIGLVYERLGRFDYSLNSYQQSYLIKEKLNDMVGTANVLNNIGMILSRRNRHNEALDKYYQSLDISESLGNPKLIAMAMNNIGETLMMQKELEKSMSYFLSALDLKEKLGQRYEMAGTLMNIGILFFYKKQYQDAIEKYDRSLKIFESINSLDGKAKVLNNLGMVYEALTQYDDALGVYNDSISIANKINNKYGMSVILKNMGLIYYRKKDLNKAFLYYNQSLNLNQELKIESEIKEISGLINTIEKEIESGKNTK